MKNRHLWTTNPPPLVNVVCERPPRPQKQQRPSFSESQNNIATVINDVKRKDLQNKGGKI